MAIKNNDFLKGIGGFGEGFIKTLQSERERKQKELEFNQEMSYKMRQQNLMSQVYLRDDIRQQQTADMNREKTEYDIRSDYQEFSPQPNAPLLPLMMGGQAGGEMNKPFNGVMNPFDEGKFYAPKPEKQQAGIDLYEDMGVEERGGKPFDRKRNKQTGEIEYFPRYEKPDKPSGSGSGSGGKDNKLDNQYLITAFGRLKNRGTGEEDKPYTPQQMDIDFNTVANDLLTPSVLGIVNGMRKGSGDYPTVEELINSFEEAGLKGKDAESAEKFLEYYSQIESSLAPTKVQWWK